MARDTNETATPARSASAPTNDSPKPPPIPPQESSASLPLPNTHSPRGSIPIQELDHESDHHQQPMTHFSESTDTHHHSDDDDSISVGSSVKSGLLHDDDARDEQEDQGLEEEDGFDVPDIHVLVGTFNLATRVLNLESGSGVPDLSPWLNPPHTSTKKPQHANGSSTTTTSNNLTIKTPSNSPPPDIVVVGFQELLSQYKAAWLPMRERSYGTAKLAVRHEEAWMQSLRNWVTLVQETLQDAYGSYTSPQGSDSDPAAAGVNAGTTDDLGPIKTSARTFDSLADRARYDLALDRKDSGIASSVAPEEKPPKAKSRHHGKTDSNSIFSTSSEEEASSSSDSGNYSPEIERIRYEPYSMSRMTALGLAVFVRVDPHSRVKIRGVWEGSMGTGLLGTYGNKGVEAIGLDIDVFEDMYLISRRLSLAFVNSHLGPHEGFDYFTWRNEELEHILRTLLFTSTVTPFGIRTIDDFHANFFFGDMNYRLIGAGVTDQRDRAVFRRSVLNYIDAKDVEALVEVDELTVLRDRQKFEPLAGFVESPIQFLPSYKYNVDSQLPTSTTTTTTT
ncbi:Endonuclease/exonuclease/phosphatase, partial [Phlyctochytrium arcticum]